MSPREKASAWRSPALPVGPDVPVWAPQAARVSLHLPVTDEVVPMRPREGGWWVSPRSLPTGTDYAYRLDDGDDLPDPRTAWQPHGVHGPSRVFDTSQVRWTDNHWRGRDLLGAVIYELHAGTFTPEGTLDSAVQRLDHLAALGVDIIELMPVAGFPGRAGWGYDGVDLWAVHEAYGGPESLARFVDAAHNAGIGVCLDVVYNHLGPSGNYLGRFGPYFTEVHETPWGSAINYDQPGCEQVRAFIIDSALRWLTDFHIDALRLDAIHEIRDDADRATAVDPHPHLLAELSDAVGELSERLGRPLSLVAESDLNDAGVITPTHAEPPFRMPSLGMTAQWTDDVHHALHARITGESQGYYADFAAPQALSRVYEHAFLHDGSWSSFRGRNWGAPVPAGTDPRRFVVFDSDHDQVGNRATGDRPAASLSDDLLAAEAALILLSPFTPMLFMGEEWGTRRPFQFFTDHSETELAQAVTQGRRDEFASFGWDADEVPDPQDSSTVTASVLDWSEPLQPIHARMLSWYQDLIALRRRLGLGERGQWPSLQDTGDVVILTIPAGTGRADVELVVVASLMPAGGSGGTDLKALVPDADELDLALSWLGSSLEGSVLRAGDTAVLTRRP